MTIDTNAYQELKKKAERLRSDVHRAEGALENRLKTIKEEFGCDTLEDAEELLEKLRGERDAAELEYEDKLAQFLKDWPERDD